MGYGKVGRHTTLHFKAGICVCYCGHHSGGLSKEDCEEVLLGGSAVLNQLV